MFSSFKLPLLRSRKNSETSEIGDITTSTTTPANTQHFNDCSSISSVIIGGNNKSPKVSTKVSKTPHGTPISGKRHQRRTSDAGGCPSIASLRPGSVAYNSDQLMPGDRIHTVNGINTSRLRSDDVITLLSNVDERALLEVEYSLPDCASQNSLCVTSKVTNITVEREDGSLGITLRGGVHGDPQLTRALVITHVRPHGPAHKTGLIKVGDRLLKVDNQCLTNKTLLEAQKILTQPNENAQTTNLGATLTTLTIEYDISVMESVKYATGPLLVEIERHLNEELGIILNCYKDNECSIFIENIIAASIADRCGALHVGDQILAIDDLYLENTTVTPDEVMCLLQNTNEGVTRLQILPYHATINKSERVHRNLSGVWNPPPRGLLPTSTPSLLSGFSTINSRRSRMPNKRMHSNKPSRLFPKHTDLEGFPACSNNYCGYHPQLGVCHTETLNITLCSEGQGYGLSVGTEQTSPDQEANIVITDIEPNSVADRCGCLQIGDRLLSINRQPNLTVQEINTIFERGYDPKTSCKLELHVEFDVADSIVPSSGIFTVKLARQTSGLGITITASKNNPEDPFIVADIRRGSIAHRIGSLRTGDRLLAIDNQNLDHTTLETAFEILQNTPHDIVTLKIEKIERNSESRESSNCSLADNVVYTVELIRYGGPLGITISGSEDCLEPIILSRLVEGGLAERTGALHVGDRILAINGENLINRPLSDAIRLLQCSGDRVQLKISRCHAKDIPCEEIRRNYPSPGVQSIDSAVESWTGSTLIETSKNDNSPEQNDDNNSGTLTGTSSLPNDNMSTTTSTATEDDGSNTLKSEESCHRGMSMNMYASQNLQYYSDTDDVFCPSPLPLPLPNYNYTNSLQNKFDTPYCNSSIHQTLGSGGGIAVNSTLTSTSLMKSPLKKNFPTNPLNNSMTYCCENKRDMPSSPSECISNNNSNTRYFLDTNFDLQFQTINNYDVYHVILYKDAVYDDYGFSVSDGLYEKGVYINRIRKGGPADIVGLLRPYDRILQVNDTKTQDFDCCLTVPLIASAGDRIELVVARNPNLDNKVLSWITEEQEMSSSQMCPQTFSNLSGSQSTITKTL